MLHYLQFLFSGCNAFKKPDFLPWMYKFNPPTKKEERPVKAVHSVLWRRVKVSKHPPIFGISLFLPSEANSQKLLFCLSLWPSSVVWSPISKAPSNTAKKCSAVFPQLFELSWFIFVVFSVQKSVMGLVNTSICPSDHFLYM